MHNYYRAIGFGKGYAKPILRNIINKAISEYKEKNKDDMKGKLIEIFVQFDKNIGLVIHGEFLDNGEFEIEYTFPFLKPKRYEYYEDINIEKNAANYSFSVACEKFYSNITIIFYLQNALDYVNCKMPNKISTEVGFAGLCLSAKIILPTNVVNDYSEKYGKLKQNKVQLFADAKNGDEEAIENLTLDEMEIYSEITKRIINEDVLTIVDTSFMPYGIECDRYSVIGKILEYEECINKITMEKMYDLVIECNDMIFNVIINQDDLYGEPAVGRRFKGNVWLQGKVNFKDA